MSERMTDAELAELCERNGFPSVRALLAEGKTQEEATAYIVGRRAYYEDGEGRLLHNYIDSLAKARS